MSQMPGMVPPSKGPDPDQTAPLVPEIIAAETVGPEMFGPAGSNQERAEARKRTRIILWVVAILGGALLVVFCTVASLLVMVYHSTGAPVAAAVQESHRVLFLPEFEARIGNPQKPAEIAGTRQLVAGQSLEVTFAQVGDNAQGRHAVRVENQGGSWVVTKSVIEFNDHTQIDLKP